MLPNSTVFKLCKILCKLHLHTKKINPKIYISDKVIDDF